MQYRTSTFKSRPEINTFLRHKIIDLQPFLVKTLGHYWDKTIFQGCVANAVPTASDPQWLK